MTASVVTAAQHLAALHHAAWRAADPVHDYTECACCCFDCMPPDRVVVAGDWHGNTRWAVGVIRLLPQLLGREDRRIVLHAGDFGVWPGFGGARYLDAVNGALAQAGAELWFADGNHEDHWYLRSPDRQTLPDGRVAVRDRIHWLPRGWRWGWAGRVWVAIGGAVSVDRDGADGNLGRSWWPEEAVTLGEAQRITEDGTADVVLAHDCPAGVDLHLPPPPPAWRDRIPAAEQHRDLLAGVAAAITPEAWIHGHYHGAHSTTVDLGWGPLRVDGLDCDGALAGNYRLLDVHTMDWISTVGILR